MSVGKAKQLILESLRHRAPNAVREAVLIEDVLEQARGIHLRAVNDALKELVAEGKVLESPFTNRRTHAETMTYTLHSYDGISLRDTIQVGDYIIPRIKDGDRALGEDWNVAFEELFRRLVDSEERFLALREELVRDRKSYWGYLITLFGVFIALFSMITGTAQGLTIDPSWSLLDVFLFNLAQVGPLTIVLIVFVVLLRIVFR